MYSNFKCKSDDTVNCFHVKNKTPCVLNKLAEVVSLLTCIQEVPNATDPLVCTRISLCCNLSSVALPCSCDQIVTVPLL
jgi:hypothetical protein